MPWFKLWVTDEDEANATRYEWIPKAKSAQDLEAAAKARLESWVKLTAIWKHGNGDVRYGMEQLEHPPAEVLQREIEAETRAKAEAMSRLRAFKAELRNMTRNARPNPQRLSQRPRKTRAS